MSITTNDIGALLAGAAPEAIEIVFNDDQKCEVVTDSFLNKIKDGNKRIWINTMWNSLCGEHTDDKSMDGGCKRRRKSGSTGQLPGR